MPTIYDGPNKGKYVEYPSNNSGGSGSSAPGGLYTAIDEAKKGKARLGNNGGNSGYTGGGYTGSSGGSSGGSSSNYSNTSSSNSSSGYSDGGSAYNSYQNMLDTYSNMIAEQQAREQRQAEEAAARQRQLAQDSYNRGMDYLNNAYNTKVGMLGDNYNSTVDQLNRSYDNSAQKVNADAARALNEAYVNHVLSQKNMGQVLAAQGLSGGATESTMAKLLANYGNSRNGIENQKAQSISDLDNTLANNLASALQQYNSALANADTEKMQYAMNLENMLANNEIAAEQNYLNALQGGNDDYLDLMKMYLNNMNNFEFNNAQATNDVQNVSTKQGSMKQSSNYNPYLAMMQNGGSASSGLGTSQSQNASNSNYLNALLAQLQSQANR